MVYYAIKNDKIKSINIDISSISGLILKKITVSNPSFDKIIFL